MSEGGRALRSPCTSLRQHFMEEPLTPVIIAKWDSYLEGAPVFLFESLGVGLVPALLICLASGRGFTWSVPRRAGNGFVGSSSFRSWK